MESSPEWDPVAAGMSPEEVRELKLALIAREPIYFDPKKFRAPERPVVYYLRWADRIKIGFTKRLGERIRAIYHDEVLAAEPGSVSLERQRHRQFREYLVPGQREWFTDSPALRFHINTIRDRHSNLVRGYPSREEKSDA